MPDKKLSAETNQITNLLNSSRLYIVDDIGGTPTQGYVNTTDLLKQTMDSAGTTGWFTTVTANRLVGKSTGTGTALIAEIFNGSSVSVFQVDGNGSILNDGNATLYYKGTRNIFIGTSKPHSAVTGNNNVVAGYWSGEDLSSGSSNSFFGYIAGVNVSTASQCSFFGSNAGQVNTTGINNSFFGHYSGGNNLSTFENSYFGYYSGKVNRGNQNIFIGSNSGLKQTVTSGTLLINNYAIADAATELTDSIIYGVMSATVANQLLRINAKTELTIIPSGATQVASGATANQIWKTASHATLPDNVLMIGV